MSATEQVAIPGIPDPILREKLVLRATGLTSSTLDRLVRSGAFPPKLRLGPRSVGWLASAVNAWIAAKVAEAQSARLVA
ncbi:AlpA family phage regulatory protein [Pseudoxanthomonas helianthi]|uniref:AlpA family phage regulatory protein n=1 Tax=Pseudoxanthomonas helianthi TaxID=1453541 RepID=A0A940X2M2_9GAMM|nr:AlpA family phage regulatory protein [Pseudoxanthomonas helianthi]MBP3984789.1 AlpA family phage regulatory protein [Pseudoxanthomonas helianthi]